MADETKVLENISGPISMIRECIQGIQLSEERYVGYIDTVKGGDCKGILNNMK